jgi:hypothetical protein
VRKRAGDLVLAALLSLAGAAPAAPAEGEHAARAARAIAKDADDLRRVAAWGDDRGLSRTADADWELSLRFDPDHDAARKRVRHVRREGAWIRDDASWALLRAVPDAHPERAAEYAARREAQFERPSASRWREIAAWCRLGGRPREADEALRTALARSPDDLVTRLALGEAVDPDEGWATWDVRARRAAEDRCAAEVRRLRAQRGEPVRIEDRSPRSDTVGKPLAAWTLRGWRLETDLPDEAAALALETADLGARWFRELARVPQGTPVPPEGVVLVVLTTTEDYVRVIDAEPGLSPAERAFARGLSAMPIPPERDKPWAVVILRPDGATAADACLHYAVHLAAKSWSRIESTEAWLYEGLAAYAGIRLFETQDSWCVRLEATSAKAVEPVRPDPVEWASAAARLAFDRDDVPARALFGATLNSMDGSMVIKSWSILRWMIEEHPEEARAFLEEKRAGRSTADALYRATGLLPEDLDAAWRLHLAAIEGE